MQKQILTALLLASCTFGREHNSLNGTWTLVADKSDFAGQPIIKSGTVTINDRQGNVTVSRSFIYENASETVFYNDTTDSQRNATVHNGKDFKSKTHWEHDVLKVATTQSGAVTLESYTPTAEGNMTATVVKSDHKPITLVFQRK